MATPHSFKVKNQLLDTACTTYIQRKYFIGYIEYFNISIVQRIH